MLSPPGDGHRGAPVILDRLFFLGKEEHSHCLSLGSERNNIGLEIDLFSEVIKVIEPTFIYLDYPGSMDVKDD